MRRIMSALILAVSLLSPPAWASELRGIIKNNEGAKRLTKGKHYEAYERFNDALVDLPFSGEVHYNLGNSFFVNKEIDKALSEYSQAIKLSPGDGARARKTRFLALFNSAVALTEQKKIEEALSTYQRALELEPDSIETKTNMELLAAAGGGEGGEGDPQQQDKGDQKDQKDGQQPQEQDQKKQPQPQQGQKQKDKPKPFDSKDMSEQDMSRILEEIKRQEEQIRAKFQREGAKDAPPEKDW